MEMEEEPDEGAGCKRNGGSMLRSFLGCSLGKPQQGKDVGNTPSHIKGARPGESFFQQSCGICELSALARQLAEVQQGKSNRTSIPRIICPFGRFVTFCEVGAGLFFLSRGQRYGTERGKHVGDFKLVSRLFCQS